jgi:RepB DNA-primase from phage plasmid
MAFDGAAQTQLPTINRKDAERFLEILDDRTDQFTFQTFDDNNGRKDGRLARIFHGTLDQHFPTLVNLNNHGAGVFVTINATNFQRQETECITEVRAYFADYDGVPLNNFKRLVLPPDIIVASSPERYHVYYLVEDAPLNKEHFNRTQLGLATLFGSDPNVLGLPRVMRLPGFLHQKNPAVPFTVRILWHNS